MGPMATALTPDRPITGQGAFMPVGAGATLSRLDEGSAVISFIFTLHGDEYAAYLPLPFSHTCTRRAIWCGNKAQQEK